MARVERNEIAGRASPGGAQSRAAVAAVAGTDAMLKAADVELVKQVAIGGAYLTVIVKGDVGSVRAAVEAGR